MSGPFENDPAAIDRSVVRDPRRLEQLRATTLLDSAEEEAFDRLTRLAAKLTAAPVTFISLVDRERDFYKSCFGFPEPLATERQMTGTTFCHFALESTGPLAIEDTLADPRYRDIPTVESLGVRAYLGVPLIIGGAAIGSFCAIDFKPRPWSALDVEVMQELAASTMREIELRQAISVAQTERNRLEALLEHVPAAVILAEAPSGRLLLANLRAEEILGELPRSEDSASYEQLVAFYVDGREVNLVDRPLARAVRGETVRGEEFRVERNDGRSVWIRVHGAPVRDASDTIVGGVVAFYDVTEQLAILSENQRLYEEARSANRAKDEFFATVSHELRTPMTAILGWSKLLIEEKLDEATTVEAAEAIAGSARLQAQLIDDLLDASRIASGKIALHRLPLNINDVIAEAIQAAQPAAAGKQVSLRVTSAVVPSVDGDASRLRQVIGNLLSNAIKFTPSDGLIEVSSRAEGKRVVVAVRDTGRGIEPELLPRIFERGLQARSAEMGGLGLGLAIVRQLVELHGGEVRAESAGSGKGSCFVVTLPESAE